MSFFEDQAGRMLAGVAADLGCDVEAFSSHSLTVVPRPAATREQRIVVQAVDTGMGTVLSVEAALVEWTRTNAPKDRHFRALQPFFLAQLAEQARSAGFAGATAHGFSLGFALARPPQTPSLPRGFHLLEVDGAWMARYRPSRMFENALGEPDDPEDANKTQVAFAALDDAGEPAAVAGIWHESHDRNEIGVEVRRESRGLGLAKAVVAVATDNILSRGRVPFYSCGATNIRSHRNALTCGFLPLYITGMVRRTPPS